MSIKKKTTVALGWNFLDNLSNLGVQFLVGIILARILSPGEFGQIGMLTFFIAISQAVVDSGFSNTLIRKKNCTNEDYSTVFYFNLIIALVCYIILITFSGKIGAFFHDEQLISLLQILGLGIIFNSAGKIHNTILVKSLEFRILARASFGSSIVAGTIAVIMAYRGLGVMSLVILAISKHFFTTAFLWAWVKWKPSLVFSIKSFKRMFSFGSKLLISGLIDTAYNNIYYLIIGKTFSAHDLGLYKRADQFSMLAPSMLTSVIQRVSYPALSSVNKNKVRLLEGYRKIISSAMLVSFFIMFGVIAIAEPLVISMVGEKWRGSILFLRLLAFSGMLYPMHALNLNILMVLGQGNKILKLEVIKKTLIIPVVAVGILTNIKFMIIGIVIASILSLYVNTYFSGPLIGYSFTMQLKDILPSLVLAAIINGMVFIIGCQLTQTPAITLLIQITIGIILSVIILEFIGNKEYIFLKRTFFDAYFSD